MSANIDILELARELWGEPNPRLSTRDDVRFGTNGSKSVRPSEQTWYDHEAKQGGGVSSLSEKARGRSKANPSKGPARRQVAQYDYVNAAGELLFQVVRFDPKDFRQRRPNGSGGWIWSMKGVERVIYRLPEVTQAIEQERIIYIAEGEKGVNALVSIGMVGTCSPGGAGKWDPRFTPIFADADVVILSDNDPQAQDRDGTLLWHVDGRPILPGQDHASEVANNLSGVARSVRVLMLPDLPVKGDVADWIAAGGTAEDLERLAAECPVQSGATPDDPNGSVEADVRRPIRVVAGELHLAASAGEAAIIATGKPIFQRGDSLVRPIIHDVAASHGRTTKAAGLGKLNSFAMFDLLSEAANWERRDGRTKAWVRINPPMQIAHILLSRDGQWKFSTIAGVITSPTLKPDGSILSAAGYDPATKLYHHVDETLRLDPELIRPSRSLAESALVSLESLLTEFPFVVQQGSDGRDKHVARAVALSGIITPIVRGALSVAPLHAFRAPTPGSGKSYLADVISAISTGRPCPVISAAPDEAEMEKRIAGLLLAGYPVVSIDNVNEELGGDLLCQAIERPLIRIRRLGGSEITEIENRATLLATGNQLRVRGDTVRRTLISDLDANMERPETRSFKSDPVATVLADRGRYVSACLMIVRAYIAAGKPGRLEPIASFGDWSNLVRSALVWLGCADPAASMDAARADDPDLAELREIQVAWAECVGFSEGFTAAEMAKKCDERKPTNIGEPADFAYPELREVLLRYFGERGIVNTRRLGKWLVSKAGRIIDGHKFERRGSAQGGAIRWAVKAMNSK